MTAKEAIDKIQGEIDLRAEIASDLIIGGNCKILFKDDVDRFLSSLLDEVEE